MASTQQHRPGAVVAGRYQLGESLGGGGVGQVYRAWDVQGQRTIAVKVFAAGRCPPDALQRYGRLVAAAGRLAHPALVLPKGLGLASRDPPLIVMDALTGDDAARLRARLARLPWARALDLVGRCAEVLHAVVSATKVAHRDLKPSNIFITDTGEVRVLDYGIAEFDVQSADSTRVDTALGVVDYKAPEQLEGAPTGEYTDVFSLGVVLFELVAGELPFRGASYYETARAILMSEAPRIADLAPGAGVPSGVEALLRRALAKRPEQRFASLKAMAEAIAQVRRSSGANLPADDETPTAAIPSQRPRAPRGAPPPVDDDAPTDHTVVGGALAPRPPVRDAPSVRDAPAPADRTVVLGGAQAPADRTVVFADAAAPARGDATMVLPDPAAPVRQDTTMVLPDPSAPVRQDTTMVLPDPAARRPESTMALPDDPAARPESTMALPDPAAVTARRTPPERSLQRTLVIVNVACGLLILIGVVVMLLTR